MPEGDTLHKPANYLRPRLSGKRVDAGTARLPAETDLSGRVVEAVDVHGKHLFLRFDDGTLLRSHLGLRGDWHRYAVGEAWKRPAHLAGVELRIGDEVYVCFMPAEVELLRERGVRSRQLAARLGPDLLDEDPEFDSMVRRAREFVSTATPLVDLLLDQRIAAGIGNVYKSELLFLQRLHPLTRLDALDDAGLGALYRLASELLRANLGGGARTTRTVDDHRGRLWVYGRAGLRCSECGTAIESAQLGRGQRSTYWCPGCQPA